MAAIIVARLLKMSGEREFHRSNAIGATSKDMGSGLSKLLGEGCVHVSLDMQNIFAPGGVWATPWMPRVLPVIA